jgi:hypothetical protein
VIRFTVHSAWLAACLLPAASALSAHEARPAYLEIKETAPGNSPCCGARRY